MLNNDKGRSIEREQVKQWLNEDLSRILSMVSMIRSDPKVNDFIVDHYFNAMNDRITEQVQDALNAQKSQPKES